MGKAIRWAAGIALVFTLHAAAQAQTFPVALQVGTETTCSFQASLMNIDPTTGAITLTLPTAAACGSGYPAPILSLESHATVSVSAATVVDGASVQVTLATGLSGSTPGLTCSPDGVVANGATVTAGWTAPLCVDCGASTTRSVTAALTSGTTGGSLQFKVKCAYTGDSAHPSVQTTVALQSSSLAVTPGAIPSACTSVEQLANPRGLTSAMRQTSASVQVAFGGARTYDVSLYTPLFGSSADTAAPGSSDPTSYGFPGTNKSINVVTFNRNSFISMQFRAPSSSTWLGRNGSFRIPEGTNPIAAAIAPCPGQFNDDTAWPLSSTTGCVVSTTTQLLWELTTGSSSKCKLVPGANYYLNLIMAPASTPASTYCITGVCSHQLINVNTY